MLLSAVSVLVVAQLSSEVPEGLMNNPVYIYSTPYINIPCVTTKVGWTKTLHTNVTHNIHNIKIIFKTSVFC